MDNLRIVLIVVALLVIIALLIHGFLINKKEGLSLFNGNKSSNKNSNKQSITPKQDIYDTGDSGIVGEVRVISKTVNSNSLNENNQQTSSIKVENPEQHDLFEHHRDEQIDSTTAINPNEPSKRVQPKVDTNPPENDKSPKSENKRDHHQEDKKSTESPLKTESKTEKPVDNEKSSSEIKKSEEEKDILILYVTGINGKVLQGDLLHNSIMQSGFQFGEMKIFHRHLDPAGNGQILFSLANMMKPGYLDPETMHELTTPGISLFMVIPTKGNNQQNFKLMLQTAQRIADDVDGVVLDEAQHMLTPQKIDEYKMRIKKACHEL